MQEGPVERDAPLVSDRQPPELGQPGERALDDPPMAAKPITTLDAAPCDAALDVAPAARRAAAAVVVALVGVQLGGPAPRPAAGAAQWRDRIEQCVEEP